MPLKNNIVTNLYFFRGKALKIKIKSVILNIVLCLFIVCVCLVGFSGGDSTKVGSEGQKVYSRAEEGKGVSLMFNVYENAEIVGEILDILSEYGATATFFIGGCWADDNVDMVRRIAKEGHEVGSHGYFHKDHSSMSYAENLAEIQPSAILLNRILDSEIRLFAPPSGAYCAATVSAAESLNLKTIMWSRDTIDWRDSDVDLIYTRATEGLETGEFILMHPKEVTKAALPQILKYIGDNSLECVSVSCNIGE